MLWRFFMRMSNRIMIQKIGTQINVDREDLKTDFNSEECSVSSICALISVKRQTLNDPDSNRGVRC